MSKKAVNNYPHALEFVYECYKTQKLYDKAVGTYPSTVKFVSECLMTQKMFDKAVNRCFVVFHSIPDRYKNQEMSNGVVSKDPFSIVYCPDKYKTQRMFDEAVNDSLAALKPIPGWFVTNKMIKKLFTALQADENILCFNEDSGNVASSCNEISILIIDVTNINLGNNFDEDDPNTIILITEKALKKR